MRGAKRPSGLETEREACAGYTRSSVCANYSGRSSRGRTLHGTSAPLLSKTFCNFHAVVAREPDGASFAQMAGSPGASDGQLPARRAIVRTSEFRNFDV